MNQRFDNVCKRLAKDPAGKLLRWIREVKELTDVHAKETGETVLENLQNDEQFEDAPYREFAETLAASDPSESCNERYNATCRKFHKRGPKSMISNALSLHRLTKKETLAKAIARRMGWPEEEAKELYDTLTDPALTDESERKAALSDVRIGNPRADMIWGGFARDLTNTDPLEGMNASEAKAVLGLGEDWYPPGEEVVHLTYLPPTDTVRHIPTVADAEWNPYWMPAKAGTGFGLTRHLGKPKNTSGQGEVVLDNGTLDWLVSPLIPKPVPEG